MFSIVFSVKCMLRAAQMLLKDTIASVPINQLKKMPCNNHKWKICSFMVL